MRAGSQFVPWSPCDVARLRILASSTELPMLAQVLGRPEKGVRMKANRLGVRYLARKPEFSVEVRAKIGDAVSERWKTRTRLDPEVVRARRLEYNRRWKYANRLKVSSVQAKRNRLLVGDYDRQAVFERDGWVCQLCGEAVPRYVLPLNDPSEPTIDHIVCLADGGPDTEDNVQLAHRWCNSAKRPLGMVD